MALSDWWRELRLARWIAVARKLQARLRRVNERIRRLSGDAL